MRHFKLGMNSWLLLVVGICLAAGNCWYTVQRSLIPATLNSKVQSVEIRREKHPGKDDVFLVHFEDGAVIETDREIAEQLQAGPSVRKTAWEAVLETDGNLIPLSYSPSTRGFLILFPVMCVILFLVAIAAKQIASIPRATDDSRVSFAGPDKI